MSRQTETCDACGRKPKLSARRDGAGLRAIYWCWPCGRAAFGGDSFVKCAQEFLSSLPLVEAPTDPQGSLF